MDFHLKQWKEQEESEMQHHQQSPSPKIPKLALISETEHSVSTLPLFVPETAATSSSSRFPTGMGSSSYFSLAQWQELELQALIYRYMIAGAVVPPELLQPIKKSLLHFPYFLHYSQYQSAAALVHSGYWGRGSMDPEPGRCRRTDGKKWRCSRDVVAGQKYCERHMHRGRNRSRKPVEVIVPANSSAAASLCGGGTTASPLQASVTVAAGGGCGTHFALSGSSPQSIDLFQSSYSSEPKTESKGGLFGPHGGGGGGGGGVDDRSDGRVLRHFFDDWPRQDSDNGNAAPPRSSTSLSISMLGNNNNNASSDVSLKLSTGIADVARNSEQQQIGNWGSGWGPNQAASMGGPLAEALRSSSATAQSSPTSVLHHLPPRGSTSGTNFVTA